MTENAAHMLTGLTLNGDWTVGSLIEKNGLDSGGFFSVGYKVKHKDGRIGYLKALDYQGVFKDIAIDTAKALEYATAAFNHEKEILKRCTEGRLNRIIRYYTDGSLTIPSAPGVNEVQYLIFEAASSDVRQQIRISGTLTLSWIVSCLHDIAVAVRQLHRISIAHQDVKPSNVLIITDDNFKLGDLGRSSAPDLNIAHDEEVIPGDPSYASIELVYQHVSSNYIQRRQGADLYQLGSLLYYFITGAPILPVLIEKLNDVHKPVNWSSDYYQVLPFLQQAFSELLFEFEADVPDKFQDDIRNLVKYLCEPDPKKRGHPKNIASRGSSYNLERIVTMFARLKRRVAIEARDLIIL